jgi:hypothetical protein
MAVPRQAFLIARYSAIARNLSPAALAAALQAIPRDVNTESELGLIASLDATVPDGINPNQVTRTMIYPVPAAAPIVAPANLPEVLVNLYTSTFTQLLRSPVKAAPIETFDFLPSDVALQRLWLRSDLGITPPAGPVQTWADQSGGGFDASQAAAPKRPALVQADPFFADQPSVSFRDVPLHELDTVAGFTVAQPTTIYVAGKLDMLAGPGGTLIDGILSSQQFGGDGVHWYMNGGVNRASAVLSDSKTHAFAAVFAGAASRLYVDSTEVAVLNPGNAGANALTQAAIGGIGGALDGEEAEVIVYSGAHDVVTIGKFFKYFAGRYGTPSA